MNGGLLDIVGLALVAACYPTLLAAVTVMLFLPNPKRLMFGYLLGAYTTSMTLGMLIVFSLGDSAAVSTTKSTISPAQNLVFGALLLLVAGALGSGRDEGVRKRRAERKAKKAPDEEEKTPFT